MIDFFPAQLYQKRNLVVNTVHPYLLKFVDSSLPVTNGRNIILLL